MRQLNMSFSFACVALELQSVFFCLGLSSRFLSLSYTYITRWSEAEEKLLCACVWLIRPWQCTIVFLALCLSRFYLRFLFFTPAASSSFSSATATASSPEAFVDPMCLSLPSLKPLRHAGLIDVRVQAMQMRICRQREKVERR